MNQDKIQYILIGILMAGMFAIGIGVYVMNQQIHMISKSIMTIEEGMGDANTVPAPQATAPTQAPAADAKTYVSCRREYLAATTNWADAKLLCTDSTGSESVVLASIDTKFGKPTDSNVSSVGLVPQGQMVYVGFRGEEDVAQYSLSYFNLKTGAIGNLISPSIYASEYLPETSAHGSSNGLFLAVAGGKQNTNPEYIDLQTIYLFDLRTATLVTKISTGQANTTFLARTDCFRDLGDINVSFTDDRMTYTAYDKPISTTDDQGACIYRPKGGYPMDYTLPR